MMDTATVYQALKASTAVYRKGPEVSESQAGGLHVTHVYAMPPAAAIPSGAAIVDVHFMKVAVDREAAGLVRDDLQRALAAYDGPHPLSEGPSYIEVGGVLGDQSAALQLFALGEVLGWWTVCTPATLGFDGDEADQMAGAGFVMISGYTPD